MARTIIQELAETVAFIRTIHSGKPRVGIILGSGLGNLSREIGIEKEIPYEDIPNFPVSTVEGHHGKLIFGTLNGHKVVVLSGRFHYYEGYSPEQVVFPVRVMKFLGVETILLSNAAGGMNTPSPHRRSSASRHLEDIRRPAGKLGEECISTRLCQHHQRRALGQSEAQFQDDAWHRPRPAGQRARRRRRPCGRTRSRSGSRS